MEAGKSSCQLYTDTWVDSDFLGVRRYLISVRHPILTEMSMWFSPCAGVYRHMSSKSWQRLPVSGRVPHLCETSDPDRPVHVGWCTDMWVDSDFLWLDGCPISVRHPDRPVHVGWCTDMWVDSDFLWVDGCPISVRHPILTDLSMWGGDQTHELTGNKSWPGVPVWCHLLLLEWGMTGKNAVWVGALSLRVNG